MSTRSAGGDLLPELGNHLRLVRRTGEQAALSQRGLRADSIPGGFPEGQPRVLFVQQGEQLLRALIDGKRRRVVLRLANDQGHKPVDQRHQLRKVTPRLLQSVYRFANHLRHVLRQHTGGLRRVHGGGVPASLRQPLQLAGQAAIDQLFISAGSEHGCILLSG